MTEMAFNDELMKKALEQMGELYDLRAALAEAQEQNAKLREALRAMRNAANFQHSPSQALQTAMEKAAAALEA